MIILLAGCDMGHLGNPLLWPVGAVSTTVENASYGAKRKKVENYVAAHQFEMISDIAVGGGPAISKGMDLAGIPQARRPEFLPILKEDIAMFRPNTPEAREKLVIALMVHGN
ncbi:MAG TPA: hypothetical protein ENJ91_07840 [Rhodobacteraceae bacterium]|nr:hypothetical protein [Paracoccaceae bacterium]